MLVRDRLPALLLAALAAAPATAQRVPDIRLDLSTAPGASESWKPDIFVQGQNLYVTWMDYRNGNMDIFFNRSLDGGKTWLLSPVRLDTGSAPGAAWSADPRIAADSQSVYVVWQDFRHGTFPMVSDIYFNRSLDGGTTWLPTDVRLNVGVAPGATLALDHDIAVSGSVVYVAWEDQRNGSSGQGRDVYLNRSLNRGTNWLPTDVRIDTGDLPGAANSIFPRLAAQGSSVHVVWSDFRNSQISGDIYYNRSDDLGASWLPAAVRIDRSTTITFGGSFGPKIDVAGTAVYVVWNDNRDNPGPILTSRDIWFNRSLDGGNTWLPADVRINTSVPAGTIFTEFPDLSASGLSVYAVWDDGRLPPTVHFNRSLDGGATWLPADVQVSTPPPMSFGSVDVPRVASTGPLVLATWADSRSGRFDIHYNCSFDSGASWLPADRRLDTGSAPGAADSFLPVPVIALSGTTPFVAWQDQRSGAEDVYLNLPFGFLPYGMGKPGSGGLVPRLRGQGLAARGQTVGYQIDNVIGGAPGVLLLGVAPASIPVLGGTLLVAPPWLQFGFTLGGPPGVPGGGFITISLMVPGEQALIGVGVFLQGLINDPGAAFGVSATDGVETWIG